MTRLHESGGPRRRGPDPTKNYPIDPIIDAVKKAWIEPNCPHEFGMGDVAHRLHVDRRQVGYWVRHGLTEKRADELAIRLGTHPALLWPSQWEQQVRE